MLMKVPSIIEIPNFLPTFSTSGVGSPPGNRTKNTGVAGVISSYVYIISNGGCSIKISPRFSNTNYWRAPDSLSGLIALSSRSLWKRLTSFRLLGSSATSALSSAYHFLHYKASPSIYWTKLAKILTVCSPHTAAQEDSGKNLRDSI